MPGLRANMRAMNTPITPDQASALADEFVALWNEADPAARAERIAAHWAPQAQHRVGQRHVRGAAELHDRVSAAHEKNVREGRHRFVCQPGVQALDAMVLVPWAMVAADGRVAATGLDVLQCDEYGRIASDHQFILS